MGNRANLGIKTDGHTIFLYQHWAPEELFNQYAHALNMAWPRIKINDNGYATRIIISQIIGNEWNSEYGFGLTIDKMYYSEHHIVIVDLDKQLVELWEQDQDTDVLSRRIVTWGVEKFIKKYLK